MNKYTCDKCNKNFSSEKTLETHKNKYHCLKIDIQNATIKEYKLKFNDKELLQKTSEYTIYEKEKSITHDGLLEVNRVGTGFMMIKRDLIKKVAKSTKKCIKCIGSKRWKKKKKEEKPEAKSRPKLGEFIIKPIESNARSAMMPVRV